MIPLSIHNEAEKFLKVDEKMFNIFCVSYNRNKLYQSYIEPKLLYIRDKLFIDRRLYGYFKGVGWLAEIILSSENIMNIIQKVNEIFWKKGTTHMLFVLQKGEI